MFKKYGAYLTKIATWQGCTSLKITSEDLKEIDIQEVCELLDEMT